MKTTNKFLAIILCVVAILMPKSAWAEVNLKYTFNEDTKTAVVAEYNFITGDCVIPATVIKDGVEYTVIAIGEKAFHHAGDMTSVTIPNTVTSIGADAFFNCTGLKSITMSNSVTSIGAYAFRNCIRLASIVLPENLTTIGEYAFTECSGLTSLTIPNSVTSIEASAFEGCDGLVSVIIGRSVKSIGERAFDAVPNLKEVCTLADQAPNLAGPSSFGRKITEAKLYVPESSLEAYQKGYWGLFGEIVAGRPIYTDCDKMLGTVVANRFYEFGETATLIAASKEGISFNGWSDGNKENPRSFVVESTTPQSYTALFRKGGFTVNVSSNDSELGTAAAENVAYLEATPTAKGEFKQWSDGNTDNPRMIPLESLTEDKEIIAEFKNGPMLIADGDQYTLTDAQTVEKLTYARGYNNNVWSAWFVPFAVNATTLKDNGFDAAYIEGMHRYDRDDDGVIDETVMEVVKIKNGRLRAGTPYLVKAGETYAYPLSLTNVTVESAEDIHNIETATATADYNFNGTYTGVTAEEVQAADNYYSMNAQGELVHRNGKILPLRWFMELIDKGGMYDAEPGSSPASVIYVKVIGEEDNETGIRTIYPESEQKVEKFDGMFDLSGRRLSAPQRGINIINGKKTLIK